MTTGALLPITSKDLHEGVLSNALASDSRLQDGVQESLGIEK